MPLLGVASQPLWPHPQAILQIRQRRCASTRVSEFCAGSVPRGTTQRRRRSARMERCALGIRLLAVDLVLGGGPRCPPTCLLAEWCSRLSGAPEVPRLTLELVDLGLVRRMVWISGGAAHLGQARALVPL